MASYHIQYQILHETLFNHLCEVNNGVNIPAETRKFKGDELDVSFETALKISYFLTKFAVLAVSLNNLLMVIMLDDLPKDS